MKTFTRFGSMAYYTLLPIIPHVVKNAIREGGNVVVVGTYTNVGIPANDEKF